MPSNNVVNLPDGTTHIFPPDATPEEMQNALGSYKAPQAQTANPPNLVDRLRPFLSGGAGILAATGTSMIPGLGESGIAEATADTQGYALMDTLLKYAGANKPKSFSEALSDSEKDAAINAVAGKLMNGVFRGVKGIFNAGMPEIYKLAPTTSQALEAQGMKGLATVSRFLEDYGVPNAKAAAMDNSAGKGFTQALSMANAINGRMYGTNSNPNKLYDAIRGQLEQGIETKALKDNPAVHSASQEALDLLNNGSDHFKVLDNVIGDPDKLSKVLNVGKLTKGLNVKEDLGAYKFMDMVQKATTYDAKSGVARIDPNQLGEMWNDPKMQTSLNTLYGKDGMERIRNFFKDIAYTQTSQTLSPQAGRFIRYMGAGKFLLNMGTLVHGITTGNLAPSFATAGVQLGAASLGRLLTSPITGRYVAEMAKGTFKASAPDNVTAISKMFANVLKNTTVDLVSPDGKLTKGSFDDNPETGSTEFQPIR